MVRQGQAADVLRVGEMPDPSPAPGIEAWGGATVIGTVRSTADLDRIERNAVRHAVALDQTVPAAQIRAAAPDGLDRIVEVALSAKVDLDAQLVRQGTVIAVYSSPDDRPQIPFWPLLFANVTLRLLGSDDFPREAKQQAAEDLTALAAEGRLDLQIAPAYPLDRIAEAHEAVEAGSRGGRVLIAL
jgi:NADPH:quinone reductase